MAKTWKASCEKLEDYDKGKYLGPLEFQDDKSEWHNFEVIELADRLVFGGACNVGFFESGFILKDDSESLDETLQELLLDLEAYYNSGPQYTSRIVCNECM